MEELNPNQNSQTHILLGGIIAIALFVGLFFLGKIETQSDFLTSDLSEVASEEEVVEDDEGETTSNTPPVFDENYSFVFPQTLPLDAKTFAVYTYVSDEDGVDDIAKVNLNLLGVGGESENTLIEGEVDGNGRIFGLENLEIPTSLEKTITHALTLTAFDKGGNEVKKEIEMKFEEEVEEEAEAEMLGGDVLSMDVDANSDSEEETTPIEEENMETQNENEDENLEANSGEENLENLEAMVAQLEVELALMEDGSEEMEVETTPNEEENGENIETSVNPISLQALPKSDGIHLYFGDEEKKFTRYFIYYATESGEYIHRIDAGFTNEFVVGKNLTSGRSYFFVVSEVDEMGNEIAFSDEVVTYLPPQTSQPTIVNYNTNLQNNHAVASFEEVENKPQTLSQEGPKEIFLISLLVSLGIASFFWRKKFARK